MRCVALGASLSGFVGAPEEDMAGSSRASVTWSRIWQVHLVIARAFISRRVRQGVVCLAFVVRG
eukprot:6566192-Alexandrium_andersonii.AAC.1